MLLGKAALLSVAMACACLATGGAWRAQTPPILATLLQLRGGSQGAGCELFSLNGNLVRVIRQDDGAVQRVVDLQSKGAVLWEKGTHSASTLDFILSNAQRTTHVPAFLRKQIAPYLADNGVPAEPAGSVDAGVELDESSGQRVAATRPPVPSGSVLSDAGGARNALSAGHAGDEDQAAAAESMLEQPAALAQEDEAKVDEFLSRLVPDGMRSNLEAFLAQIKAINQQTYGDDLDRALAAVAKDELVVPPPVPATGSAAATNDSMTTGSGAENASVRQDGEASSVNLDAVRLAEALGVLQEGVRQAALAGVTPEELAPRQRAQAAVLGLAEGEKPPGFRVLDRYAEAIMGKKELFPAPRGVTGADAIVATWIFDEARGEKEDAGGGGGIDGDGVQEPGAPGASRLSREGDEVGRSIASAAAVAEEEGETAIERMERARSLEDLFDGRSEESEARDKGRGVAHRQSTFGADWMPGHVGGDGVDADGDARSASEDDMATSDDGDTPDLRPRTLQMEVDDVFAAASQRKRREEAAATANTSAPVACEQGVAGSARSQDEPQGTFAGVANSSLPEGPVADGADGAAGVGRRSGLEDVWREMAAKLCTKYDGMSSDSSEDVSEGEDTDDDGMSADSGLPDVDAVKQAFAAQMQSVAEGVHDAVRSTHSALAHKGVGRGAAGSGVVGEMAAAHARATGSVANKGAVGVGGQGGETSIWDALGVPKGASDHEIVAAWESVRKQKLAEIMSGDAGHEVEPAGEKAGGVKPGWSCRNREGVADGGTEARTDFEENQEALKLGGGIPLTTQAADGGVSSFWVPSFFAREKHETEESQKRESGLQDALGERNPLGLPKEFDSDDISEPGTIQSVLEALQKAPLTDRQGRELPSLSVDGEGWFKGIDEETPAVKDLLAEPEHPGVISKLQDVKDTVQQKGRKGSAGASSRLGPFEKGDKGADDPHARA